MSIPNPPTNTTISIKRATRTSDNAGGKTETFSTVYSGVAASIRYFRSMSELSRMESPTGVTSEHEMLVVVRDTTLTIQINDLVVSPSGAKYTVLFVKPYAYSTQLRVRRMQ